MLSMKNTPLAIGAAAADLGLSQSTGGQLQQQLQDELEQRRKQLAGQAVGTGTLGDVQSGAVSPAVLALFGR
jgi:hypothetical protein